MEQTYNETIQISVKNENPISTLNNANNNNIGNTINNQEVKDVMNNNIQQTSNALGENNAGTGKNNASKKSDCEEKCPWCFCKVKCLFCYNPCDKAGREKYEKAEPKTCCCLLTILFYLLMIWTTIWFFCCFYLPCKCMSWCGDACDDKKKDNKDNKNSKKKSGITVDSILDKFAENYSNARHKANNLKYAREDVERCKKALDMEDNYDNRDKLYRAEKRLERANFEYDHT